MQNIALLQDRVKTEVQRKEDERTQWEQTQKSNIDASPE
jgi:hypothetical protein